MDGGRSYFTPSKPAAWAFRVPAAKLSTIGGISGCATRPQCQILTVDAATGAVHRVGHPAPPSNLVLAVQPRAADDPVRLVPTPRCI